jgi:hypothetical protein
MSNHMDLDTFTASLPPELTAALSEVGGLSKLAASMYGLPNMDERTLFERIGTKLAMSRLEKRAIDKGIAALAEVATWEK